MKVEDKLITHPGLQPALQRTLFGVLTFAAWTLYLYLWIPLATFLLWFAGLRLGYINLDLHNHQVNLWLLVQLLGLALGCAAALLGWAEYNRIRFQGQDRRSRQGDARLAEMAQALGARQIDAQRLQSARIAVIVMDEDAKPVAVRLEASLDGSGLAVPPGAHAVAEPRPERPLDDGLASQPAG